jgi:hypothetical protein
MDGQYVVQFFQLPDARFVGTEPVDVVVVVVLEVVVVEDVVVVGDAVVDFEVVLVLVLEVVVTVLVAGGPTQRTWPTCKSQFASIHELKLRSCASVSPTAVSILEQKSPDATCRWT